MPAKIIFSSEQISQIKQMYDNKVPVKEIQNIFNISNTTFYRILQRNNIDKVRNVYSIRREDDSKERFVSKFTNNIPYIPLNDDYRQKGYYINENYFDIVDNQDKAYIIGLFLADGNITKDKKNIQISLQERDGEILEKIKSKLQYEGPLLYKKYNDLNPNWKDQSRLAIYSPHMCRALEHYCVVPNKSLILNFPTNIDISLYPHMLRGYVDGDGSITSNPREKRVRFVSTMSFCQDAKLLIENQLNINCSVRLLKKSSVTSELMIAGRRQTTVFLDWIYKDANLYLERKYKIYKSLYNNTNDSLSL